VGARSRRLKPLQVMECDRLPDLTQPILDLASLAAQILAHMARSQSQGLSAPDAPPPERVFRDLLGETLRPVLKRHRPDAIEAARRVLVDAVETIESEILLVEPSPRSHDQSRPSRTPRRPL
jgi:hypothetical protein